MNKYIAPEYELCIVDTTDIMSNSPAVDSSLEAGGNLNVDGGTIIWP
ncbi:MAG: hypothetical protein IJZ93_02730 [Clostridia bacterium]|nr:hypothetical protein [Clostridia bacterium]